MRLRRRSGVVCPLCGTAAPGFRPYAGRRGARCGRCGALERHRHLWLYLERRPELLAPGARVLHLAPERPLAERLRRLDEVEYLSGDLEPGAADRLLDLRALDLPDGHFSLILCLHVLEHVDDDRRALAELHRVLAPGGVAILQVPRRRGPTLEDPAVTTREERRARFAQEDHVRVYGDDYPDRIRAAGFDVAVDVFRDELGEEEQRRFGLRYAGHPDPLDDRLWEVVVGRYSRP